jgi:hypothetical protein
LEVREFWKFGEVGKFGRLWRSGNFEVREVGKFERLWRSEILGG